MADRTGTATFRTIFPGWYSGRAVHIHLKVHASRTRNADPPKCRTTDGIFEQSGGSTVVATELSGDWASSQVAIGVERAKRG